jgi:hypothetical protein
MLELDTVCSKALGLRTTASNLYWIFSPLTLTSLCQTLVVVMAHHYPVQLLYSLQSILETAMVT